MTSGPDRGQLLPAHLEDTQLLAFLDGELPPAEMAIARAHVDSCWICRSRLSGLLGSIDTFLESRTSLPPIAPAEREQRIRQFRERLARHTAEVESQLSFGQRLRDRWNEIRAAVADHRRAALALAVAACLLIAMFTDLWGTKLSAETVLARAAQYESGSRPPAGHVARVAVRVEHIDRATGDRQTLGEVTLLEDSLSPSEFVSVQTSAGETRSVTVPDAALADGRESISLMDVSLPPSLATFLEQHWQPDFSVAALRRLLAARGTATANAEKQGNLFALHFPFAPGHVSGIAEAQLLVESRNYAPVSLSLFTAAEEYRFTRVTMAIEPRTAEVARLFGGPDISQTARPHNAPELPRLSPLSYENSQATDREVRVASALHKADACLGEELHIFPMSDGSLLVQGLVDQPERRDAIRRALQPADPRLRIQVFLPRELRSGSQLFRSPYKLAESSPGLRSAPVATLADLSNDRMPMYEELFHHFAKPGVTPEEAEKQVNAFSAEAVTLARQTFLHAWALKKLDEEFAVGRAASLSPASMAEIEGMRQDHRRWIATLSHRQADMLSQVIHLPGTESPVNPAASDADSLIRLAREQNELVRSLFTVSAGTAETQSTLSQLLAVLHRMGA